MLIERRNALEAFANELFEVVTSGKVRVNVNQRFAPKDAADAHKALEARATSGSSILDHLTQYPPECPMSKTATGEADERAYTEGPVTEVSLHTS